MIRTSSADYPVEGSLKEAIKRAKELKLHKWRITKPGQKKVIARSR